MYQQVVIISDYKPLSLKLTAVSEDIVIDNIEVFRKNGFEFSINKEGNFNYYSAVYYIISAPPTKRVKLIGQSVSKDWSLGTSGKQY